MTQRTTPSFSTARVFFLFAVSIGTSISAEENAATADTMLRAGAATVDVTPVQNPIMTPMLPWSVSRRNLIAGQTWSQ